MAYSYGKEELQRMITQAAETIGDFYNADCVNYTGRTNDTGELYTELIAKWCIDNIDKFDSIEPIVRRGSYRCESHDGMPEEPTSNRQEEHIAKALFRQSEVPGLGEVRDYQTPLEDGHGMAIDLLAYDGQTLRILELKRQDSKETMLRAVLEAQAYLKKVDKAKLLRDFELTADTKISASPLVFVDSAQYQEMQENRPYLKQLMNRMDIQPLFLRQTDSGRYVVEP